ncbi:hypothetical protein Q6247_27220, partial [Klebsiella pneumoniae]
MFNLDDTSGLHVIEPTTDVENSLKLMMIRHLVMLLMTMYLVDKNPLGLVPDLSMRGHGVTRLVDGDDVHSS